MGQGQKLWLQTVMILAFTDGPYIIFGDGRVQPWLVR